MLRVTVAFFKDNCPSKATEADLNSKNQQKIDESRKFIKKEEEEIQEEVVGAEAFSQQLGSLDDLKIEMLKNLPFADLEIVDQDIHIGGIPFDTINEAEKIRFVLKVAGLRETELPLVCVDGLEALDEETFKLFEDEAGKTNMQFFVTRVSEESELTVKS